MKKTLLYISFVFCSFISVAQQVPMVSEFMLNSFIYNPAMGGRNGIPIVNIGYRTQWVGFEGAPKTFYVSGNGTIMSKKKSGDLHDAGGYMFTDASGPLATRGVSGSYTYHKEIFKDHVLSMGTFLGVIESSLDLEKVTLPEKNVYDPAIYTTEFRKNYAPDGSIGMLFYNEDYSLGFSVRQLLGGKFNYGDSTHLEKQNSLYNHIYVMASYDFLLNDNFILEPNVLIKSVRSAPLQLDFNIKLNYRDLLFAGVTARTQDAMSFIFGFDVKNVGEFGYAYDLGLSKFRSSNRGSHEILVTFRFEDSKRKTKFKPKEIVDPVTE